MRYRILLCLLGCCQLLWAMPAGTLLMERGRNLPAFTQVKVHGDMDVQFITGQKQHKAQSVFSRKPVYARIHNKVLYLCTNPLCRPRPIGAFHEDNRPYSAVKVYVRQLQKLIVNGHGHMSIDSMSGARVSLHYQGSGYVTVHRLRAKKADLFFHSQGNLTLGQLDIRDLALDIDTPGKIKIQGKNIGLSRLSAAGDTKIKLASIFTSALDVSLLDRSQVELTGIANLKHLSYSGDGTLKLHWLYTCDLDIAAHGHGHAFLAGVANTVKAEIAGSAVLDAKFLRAERVYSRTQGQAKAEFWPQEILTAFARERSMVTYYHEPRQRYFYPKDNASVLPAKANIELATPAHALVPVKQCHLHPIRYKDNQYTMLKTP